MSASESLARRARWRWPEIVFWLAAFAAILAPAGKHLMMNEIAVLALFALSLDLILGYAGIISLGHAAFFGFGAYAAGLICKHVTPDPLIGLALAMALTCLLGLVTSLLVLRGSDLTRLMVTLGVASILYELANRFAELTGGADGLQGVVIGPLLGRFAFGLDGKVAYLYSLTMLVLLFVLARRVAHSPFGHSLQAIRDNRLRAGMIGIDVSRRLAAVYTIAAAIAGVAGALLAQTTGFASLDVLDFHRSADVMLVLVIGGTGYLYGGLIGAVVFVLMKDLLSNLTPQYWQFWVGLVLVSIVLLGHERIVRPWHVLTDRFTRRANAPAPRAAQ
jgi:branched-chain amino acid transport system permease protein